MDNPVDEPLSPSAKASGLFQERAWEKYLFLLVAVVCLADAFGTALTPLAEEGFVSFIRSGIRDGAFHSGLLFCVLFYLSEARHRATMKA